MHFGENVREIVSASCGKDLRAARSRTVLPGIDSPEVQRRLAANLERAFGISLSPEDVTHLTTVRAVLQCVRLRRWEREMAKHDARRAAVPTLEIGAPTATQPGRERFLRYTPPTPAVHVPATAPSFALRKS
jgi:acyl carrier protein